MKKFLSTNVAAIILVAAFALVSFTNTTGKAGEEPNTTKAEASITAYTYYQTVYDSRSPDWLSVVVRLEMEKGWQPLGGVSSRGDQYIQAMVK